MQELNVDVATNQTLVTAVIDALLRTCSPTSDALAEIMMWAALGREPLAGVAWSAMAALGVKDRNGTLAAHMAGWRGGDSSQALYRRRVADFLFTWRSRCASYMTTRSDSRMALPTRASVSVNDAGDWPKYNVPPTFADTLNYFIFVEEERQRQLLPRSPVRVVEAVQPTVRPDSHVFSTVSRIGYVRPVTPRDDNVLPPIAQGRRGFLQLVPKMQAVAPYSDGSEGVDIVTDVCLSGLRANNRLFKLAQSWAPN